MDSTSTNGHVDLALFRQCSAKSCKCHGQTIVVDGWQVPEPSLRSRYVEKKFPLCPKHATTRPSNHVVAHRKQGCSVCMIAFRQGRSKRKSSMLGVKREYDTHSHTHSPLGDSVSRSLMTRSTRIGWSSFPASKWYAVWPIFWLTREHDDNGTFVRPTYELMKKCDFCTFDDNRERKILG